MNMNLIVTLILSFAWVVVAQDGDAPKEGFDPTFFLTIMIAIVAMYFFILRPEAKKNKDKKKMVDSLKKGDKIVTIGGFYGTVSAAKDGSDTVEVKISSNTTVKIAKSAIGNVLSKDKESKDSKENKKDTEDKKSLEKETSEGK